MMHVCCILSVRYMNMYVRDSDPNQRLGAHSNPPEDIMSSRFFSGIDWDAVYNRTKDGPWVPEPVIFGGRKSSSTPSGKATRIKKSIGGKSEGGNECEDEGGVDDIQTKRNDGDNINNRGSDADGHGNNSNARDENRSKDGNDNDNNLYKGFDGGDVTSAQLNQTGEVPTNSTTNAAEINNIPPNSYGLEVAKEERRPSTSSGSKSPTTSATVPAAGDGDRRGNRRSIDENNKEKEKEKDKEKAISTATPQKERKYSKANVLERDQQAIGKDIVDNNSSTSLSEVMLMRESILFNESRPAMNKLADWSFFDDNMLVDASSSPFLPPVKISSSPQSQPMSSTSSPSSPTSPSPPSPPSTAAAQPLLSVSIDLDLTTKQQLQPEQQLEQSKSYSDQQTEATSSPALPTSSPQILLHTDEELGSEIREEVESKSSL